MSAADSSFAPITGSSYCPLRAALGITAVFSSKIRKVRSGF